MLRNSANGDDPNHQIEQDRQNKPINLQVTEDDNFKKIHEEIQQEYNDNVEDVITMEKNEVTLDQKK